MSRPKGPALLICKLYLYKTDWERVKRIAETEDRTASGLVRNFIAAGLAEQERIREQTAA
jgi:hypothetical protein